MSLNHVDFTGRMQEARDMAARERHLGRAASRPQFAKPAPLEDTPENRLHAELASLRSEIKDRDNTIAVLQAGGDPDAALDPGAEFDRLFTAANAQRRGLPPPPPLSPHSPTSPARQREVRTLTANQYLAALKKLGLTPASKRTAAALGLTVRQCQKYAAGTVAVPETVAKLIAMYLAHGIPSPEKV